MINRKTLLSGIIGLILILIASISGGFLILKQKKAGESNTPTIHQLTLKKVYSEPVISPTSSLGADSLWFGTRDGRIFRADLQNYEVSQFGLPGLYGQNLKEILWQPGGQDFLAVTTVIATSTQPVTQKQETSYYNSKNGSIMTLPPNVQDVAWLPDGKRVAIIWRSGDGKTKLVVSDPDATGYHIVAELPWNDPVISVSPINLEATIVKERFEGENSPVLHIDLDNGKIKTLVDKGYNENVKWLPDGKKFLYSSGSAVFSYDLATEEIKDLGLQTNTNRVAIDPNGRYLYAAVGNAENLDKFVKYDLEQNSTEDYFLPEGSIRILSPLYFASRLFFVDSGTGEYDVIE